MQVNVDEFVDVIDMTALLSPIAGDAPQGRDLRSADSFDTPLVRLKDARTATREAERRAADPGDEGKLPAPDWGAVVRAAEVVLTGHSKDLEAAAWLAEALLRTHGLRGLGAGARLVSGLVDRYWGTLFPGVDEDEPDEDPAGACTRALTGLAGERGTLLPPLRLLPLFAARDGSPVSLVTYDAAVVIARLDADQQERRIAEGAVSLEMLDEQAKTDPDGLAELSRDAAAALEAWQAMEAVLAERAGRARPNTGEARTLLQRIAGIAGTLVPAAAVPATSPGGTQEAFPPQPTAGPATDHGDAAAPPRRPVSEPGPGTAGPITSREDALRRLKEIADWFRRNEPQSPLAYTLDEAVRRGRLSMPDLLAEIVADEATRAGILRALGIQPPPVPSE